VKPADHSVDRLAAWLGREISAEAHHKLELFATWLVDEAAQLGGIGQSETNRVWDRHVLDSAVFAKDLAPESMLLDVGSGVGLPGVPIAILHPGPVTLLDRSERRTDALQRICAVLDLDVVVIHRDVAALADRFDRVTMRASLTLDEARRRAPQLCTAGGELWFGLGRGVAPLALAAWACGESPENLEETLISVPSGVLDSPAWLLRMTPT